MKQLENTHTHTHERGMKCDQHHTKLISDISNEGGCDRSSWVNINHELRSPELMDAYFSRFRIGSWLFAYGESGINPGTLGDHPKQAKAGVKKKVAPE
jgi:hypothetical protein